MWHLSKFIHWPILLRHPTWIRCLCLFYFILFLKNRCRCCRKHYVVQIKPLSPFIFIPPKSRLVTSFHFTSYLNLQGTQLTWKHAFSPTIPSPKPLINSSPQSETGLYHTPNDLLNISTIEKLEFHFPYHVSSSY